MPGKKVMTMLVVAGVAQAANPISNHGCQCTSGCSLHLALDTNKYCDVDKTICTDSSDGNEDKCGSLWGDVSDLYNYMLGAGANVAQNMQKIGAWSMDNIQKIPLGEIKDNAASWSSDVLSKLSDSQWNQLSFEDVKDWTKDKLDAIPTAQITKWTKEQINSLSESKLAELTKAQIGALDKAWAQDAMQKALTGGQQLADNVWAGLTSDQMKDLSADLISKMGDQWNKIDMAAIGQWSKEQVEAIPVDKIATWSREQVAKIPVEKITDFSLAQIQAIPYDKIGAFSKAQWDKVPMESIATLSWQQLQKIDYETVASWTNEKWDMIPVDKMIMFTGAQIGKIPGDKVAQFTDGFWNAVPVYQVAHFTATQLQNAGIVENIDPDKIAAISDGAWKSVPAGDITKLSIDQLQNVDYEALGGWTKEQWDALPVDKAITLTGKQINSIPPEKVGSWTQEQWLKVPVKEMVMFTGDQINDASTLAKLSIDQLAALNAGELDTTKLDAEVKKQLEEKLGISLEDKAKLDKATVETVLANDDARIALTDSIIALGETTSNPDATQADKDAAHTAVSTAKANLVKSENDLIASGYMTGRPTPAPAVPGVSGSNMMVPSTAFAIVVAYLFAFL